MLEIYKGTNSTTNNALHYRVRHLRLTTNTLLRRTLTIRIHNPTLQKVNEFRIFGTSRF